MRALSLELWVMLPVEHDPCEGCTAIGGLGDLGVYWGPQSLFEGSLEPPTGGPLT